MYLSDLLQKTRCVVTMYLRLPYKFLESPVTYNTDLNDT